MNEEVAARRVIKTRRFLISSLWALNLPITHCMTKHLGPFIALANHYQYCYIIIILIFHQQHLRKECNIFIFRFGGLISFSVERKKCIRDTVPLSFRTYTFTHFYIPWIMRNETVFFFPFSFFFFHFVTFAPEKIPNMRIFCVLFLKSTMTFLCDGCLLSVVPLHC